MWVAKRYRNSSYYCLWNRCPWAVSDKENIHDEKTFKNYGMVWNWLSFESYHGYLPIPSKYNKMFDGKTFPLEVELVRDDSEDPMFYLQKILDIDGKPHLYLDTRLEYSYRKYYKRWIFGRKLLGCWVRSCNPPQGEYADLSVNVSTDGRRIPLKAFDCNVEDGYIPVKIKIK